MKTAGKTGLQTCMAAVVHAVTLDSDAMSNLVSRFICKGR
jgi:hypothetical protein